MCIVMGVAPGIFLKPMEPAVRKTIDHIRPASSTPLNTGQLVPSGGRGKDVHVFAFCPFDFAQGKPFDACQAPAARRLARGAE